MADRELSIEDRVDAIERRATQRNKVQRAVDESKRHNIPAWIPQTALVLVTAFLLTTVPSDVQALKVQVTTLEEDIQELASVQERIEGLESSLDDILKAIDEALRRNRDAPRRNRTQPGR